MPNNQYEKGYTPGVCGQEGSLTVSQLQALSAAFIDKATQLSVTVDGIAKSFRPVQSQVFSVALPEDNLFVWALADQGHPEPAKADR
jgi:hypothetical protein